MLELVGRGYCAGASREGDTYTALAVIAVTNVVACSCYLTAVVAMACGRNLTQLSFVGLMGMWDPPRDSVERSIGQLRGSGVSVKMITGDARETGETIAQHLRLWSPGSLSLSGEQLESLPPQDLADNVMQVCVCLSVCLCVDMICVCVCTALTYILLFTGCTVLQSYSEAQSHHSEGRVDTTVGHQSSGSHLHPLPRL